ncbi:MAG: alginate O-acetyltransferase AlgX-related protein, partial [Gemmatimonas sp.]
MSGDSLSWPNLAFARILCARGIPFIDLTGPFRDAESHGEGLYFRQDRHWNAKGHELAARLLSQAVLDLSANPAASAPVRCVK